MPASEGGFDLISVTEPDPLRGDPTRTLLRQMMGAIEQYEKLIIVAKLRGARSDKRRAWAGAKVLSLMARCRVEQRFWTG